VIEWVNTMIGFDQRCPRNDQFRSWTALDANVRISAARRIRPAQPLGSVER
jgi:hypothetical protein